MRRCVYLLIAVWVLSGCAGFKDRGGSILLRAEKAEARISDYDQAAAPDGNDTLIGIDVDDLTMSPTGTTKKYRLRDLPISDPVQTAMDSKQDIDQAWVAFTADDQHPDVSSGHQFKTANAVIFTDADDGGDSSTLEDGRHLFILCLHAATFDFTSSGFKSPFDEDFTAPVNSIQSFKYDATQGLWVWENPQSPVETVSAAGLIASDGAGGANPRTVAAGTAGVDVGNGSGASGDPTISLDVAPSSGSPTLEESEDALQVKYSGTHLGEGANGLYVKPMPLRDSILDPADADDAMWLKLDRAITVTDIHCLAEGGGTITLTVQECDSTGASCANTEGAITCDSNGSEDDGTLTDASGDAGDWIKILYSAPTGTVNSLAWSVYIQ